MPSWKSRVLERHLTHVLKPSARHVANSDLWQLYAQY